MLSAGKGDCLWISYGAAGASHHIVIDGGPKKTPALRAHVNAKLESAAGGGLHIDLLVVTHIDDDHIGGVLNLLRAPPDGLTIGEIWFNGRPQLFPPDTLGVDQGERLSDALEHRKDAWNSSFAGGPVVVPDAAPLPCFKRPDGLQLTLLSPSPHDLERLKQKWSAELATEDQEEPEAVPSDLLGLHDEWPPKIESLADSKFVPDPKAANGSSIALLLEYQGKRVLLAADAHAPRLVEALDRLDREKPLGLDALKLSHHGSAKNTSRELLFRVCCGRYLISSDGSYFGHPDPAAIARVIIYGGMAPELLFNSARHHAARWDDDELKREFGYQTRHPRDEKDGMLLSL